MSVLIIFRLLTDYSNCNEKTSFIEEISNLTEKFTEIHSENSIFSFPNIIINESCFSLTLLLFFHTQ